MKTTIFSTFECVVRYALIQSTIVFCSVYLFSLMTYNHDVAKLFQLCSITVLAVSRNTVSHIQNWCR